MLIRAITILPKCATSTPLGYGVAAGLVGKCTQLYGLPHDLVYTYIYIYTMTIKPVRTLIPFTDVKGISVREFLESLV